MIKWNGGSTPKGIKDNTLVKGVYRGGETFGPTKGWACDALWKHLDSSSTCDIIEYEIVWVNE